MLEYNCAKKEGEVVNRIKELREKKGMSIDQLSKELKKKGVSISPASISKYEREERKPKIDKWVQLADFFDVPVSYLQGISKISDKDTFYDLKKWLSAAGNPVDDEKVSISMDELESRTQELTLTMFNNAFNNLVNSELFTGKLTQEKFKKIKDTLSIDDIGAMQDIVGLASDVFKIGLEALNDKKAKKAYDELYKITFNYLGIDEDGLPQDGDTIRHKSN